MNQVLTSKTKSVFRISVLLASAMALSNPCSQVHLSGFVEPPGDYLGVPSPSVDWSKDIRLTFDPKMSVWPSVDTGPQGNVYLSWISADDIQGGELHFMKTDRSGSVKVTDRQLTQMSTHSKFPEIAVDTSGRGHLVWIAGDLSQSEVFYALLDKNGSTLIGPTQLSRNPTPSYSVFVDTDSLGRVHVVWREGGASDRKEVLYSKLDPSLDDQDGSPADESAISTVNDKLIEQDAISPRIVISYLDQIHVSYAKNQEIWYEKIDHDGNPLVDATRLTYASGLSANPSLASDSNGTVSISWNDKRLGPYDVIFYTKIRPDNDDQDGDSGEDSNLSLIDDFQISRFDENFSYMPTTTIAANGSVNVIWTDAGVPNYVYRSRLDNNGNIDIDLEFVNAIRGECAISQSHVVDSAIDFRDRIYITWWDNRDGQDEIYLKYTLYEREIAQNNPPIADAGGPYFGSEGSQITLNASKSFDPDGDELEFRWDFENDGTWDSGWSSADSISHTWYDDFEGQVTVEVRERREVNLDVINDGEYKRYSFVDEDFEQAQSFKPTQPILSRVAVDVSVLPSVEPTGSIILHVRKTLYGPDIVNSSLPPGVMPIGTRNPFALWPRFDVSDISVIPGEQYFIVLTCPTCSKGYYHVEFSDDTYPNGTSFLKRPGSNSFTEYPDNDLRFATFWANFSTPQLSDKDTANITIGNLPPKPEWTSQSADGTILTPPYPEGKEIAFEATVSDPGIYDTFTYDWDFGDSVVLLDAGPKVTHTYGDDKTYTVVLTVIDDDGGVGVDDTPPLPTTNENPVPVIHLPYCIFVEGLHPCDAIGEFSDPGWLDTHTAIWDFGDGTSATAVLTEEHSPPDSTGSNITSHMYGDNGLYTITFTVNDDDGGKGTVTAEVPVQNEPPNFDLYIPITVNEGEQFVLGVEARDPGSDDLIIKVDWGDGTSDTHIYFNDGVGPDPPNSAAGVYPFVVQTNFTHVYPDDGDHDVTVMVEDDDGGADTKTFQIPVLNVPPTVTLEVLPIEVNASLRIAGEQWHDVTIELYEDGILIFNGTIVRYPGSPNDQMLDMSHLQIDVSKRYTATVRYTPEDDPVNGQPNGANPCWIILRFNDGQELWLHHTFNVQHPEGYVWEVDLTSAILSHGITFRATAFDPGADDLTFHWDFGDGTNVTNIYPNPNGTYPVSIVDTVTHTFPGNGTYTITVTVEDDDGGIVQISYTLTT
jgi:hypothetical protein